MPADEYRKPRTRFIQLTQQGFGYPDHSTWTPQRDKDIMVSTLSSLETMVATLGVSVTFFGTLISWLGYASNRRVAREANLRSAWTTFSRDSATLDRAYIHNAPPGLNPLSRNADQLGGLLGRPEWQYSGGPLRNLAEASIGTTLTNSKYSDWVTPRLRRAGLLPYKKWDLLSNLRVVTGEGPHWSSRVFRVNSIVGTYKSGLQLNVCEGEYYDFFNSGVGMGLLSAFRRKPGRSIAPSISRLRNRMWTVGVDRVDIRGYFAILNVACLTVIVNDSGAFMLIHRRGDNVTDNRRMFGPVPSGSHASFLDSDNPATLLDTLKREFAEELLGVDETGESPQRHIIEEALGTLIEDNKVYLLGAGLYPVQGYVMALTLCVIDERGDAVQSWLSSRGAGSTLDVIKENYEGTIVVRPFERDEICALQQIHRRTPCLGEIARIVSNNFDTIKEYVMQPSSSRG